MPRRLIPEWETQAGVMLTWPHAATDWAGQLVAAERTYLEITTAISRFESLLIVAYDEGHATSIESQLRRAGIPRSRFTFGIAPSNDTWTRDHGPIAIEESDGIRLLDFRFNGWGGKYAYDLDDAITQALHLKGCFGEAALETLDLVFEGGGIDTDGCGTLLVTESCLLAPTRNPSLDRFALEAKLREMLGITRIYWLNIEPLPGDDTDGHIDTLARFCNPETIAYVQCHDTKDPCFNSLQRMERQLRTFTNYHGERHTLVPLPSPSPVHDENGRRLPATYANFLIINNAVLVPTYRDAADRQAIEVLSHCFPEREIIGIDCSTLIQQNGSLHCITMQLPQGTIAI